MTNAAAYYNLVGPPGSGTNGVYVLWSMHNDVSGIDPWVEINTLSNHLNSVIASNFLPVVITTEPRAGFGTDIPVAWKFQRIVNNWVRKSPLIWRVVDASSILGENYDPVWFVDDTHCTPAGYQLIVSELNRVMATTYQVNYINDWVGVYGTNIIAVAPGSNAEPSLVWSAGSMGMNIYESLNVNGSISAAGITSPQPSPATFAWSAIPAYSSTVTNYWTGTWTNGTYCCIWSNTSSTYAIKQLAP
jgi:hypothetical protein